MYWGNSGFGFDITGKFNNRGLEYPNCAVDAPARGARARARHVREHHQHNWGSFSPSMMLS